MTAALVARVVHRGPYVAGWDLIAPTEGQFLASTSSFWAALREVVYENRHQWNPFSEYSVPFSLIPGYLGRVWPWEYWVHVLTLLSFGAALLAVIRATETPLRDAGIVLLAWGASPLLLSLSVTGFPWASAFLPHALALWITMSRRLRGRWLATILGTLGTLELSWHVYELGKTVGIVFVLAALLQRDARRWTRALWLVAGLGQLVEAVLIHPSANFPGFGVPKDAAGKVVGGTAVVLGGLRTLATAIGTFNLDLPLLLVAGLLSFLFFRRDRWFLLLLLLAQLAGVFLLAMSGPGLMRPRRFMMVSCYCVVCVAAMYREAGPWPRRALVALLLIGNVWQAAILLRFVRTRFPPTIGFTLPYVHSLDGVGLVTFPYVDWAQELRGRVERGERLLLVYNFGCYHENVTNPVGVLERLYLSLGHERFVRSVFAFGSVSCRYSCLPIHPLSDLGPFLDGVRPDGPTPPDTLTGYYGVDCNHMDMHAAEMAAIYATVRQRLTVTERSRTPWFVRFDVGGVKP